MSEKSPFKVKIIKDRNQFMYVFKIKCLIYFCCYFSKAILGETSELNKTNHSIKCPEIWQSMFLHMKPMLMYQADFDVKLGKAMLKCYFLKKLTY